MNVDFRSPEPPTSKPTVLLTPSDKFFIESVGGIGISLVEAFGTQSDVSSLRNRGNVEFAMFLYAWFAFSAGGIVLLGGDLLTDIAYSLGGVFLAYLFMRIDAFLNMRGLYHQGKRALVAAGATLVFGSEDIAWYVALAGRFVIGITQALLVGTLIAQIVFAGATEKYENQLAATKNAAVIAKHSPLIDNRIKALADQAAHDMQESSHIREALDALRKRNVALINQATRQTVQQRARTGSEEAQRLSWNSMAGYEARSIAADTAAKASSQAYEAARRTRNADLQLALESDPNYVPQARDLLSRLADLKALATQDSWVAIGIAVIDALGVGLEFWLIIMAFAQSPTRLSIALYIEHMKSTSASAQDLVETLNRYQPADRDGPQLEDTAKVENDELRAPVSASHESGSSEISLMPLRRGRGRPKGSTNKVKNGLDRTLEEVGDE